MTSLTSPINRCSCFSAQHLQRVLDAEGVQHVLAFAEFLALFEILAKPFLGLAHSIFSMRSSRRSATSDFGRSGNSSLSPLALKIVTRFVS